MFVDLEARDRILALEEQAVDRNRQIAALSARLSHGARESARLFAMIEAIRTDVSQLKALAPPASAFPLPSVAVPPNHLASEPATPSAPAEKPHTSAPAPTATDPRRPVPSPQQASPPAASAVARPDAAPVIPSLIVSQFPALFAEFRGKRFTLLWRGSRDGFGAGDFHRRCDGHANTLTLIKDTAGNIFGGFTPVAWESQKGNYFKADPSLTSYVFTLKNFPAKKFALKPQEKEHAIICDSSAGPRFYDIGVRSDCNANDHSFTGSFGAHYVNDTGLDGITFFTGSNNFIGKEIEVFEITD
jgi:hypothetical protein